MSGINIVNNVFWSQTILYDEGKFLISGIFTWIVKNQNRTGILQAPKTKTEKKYRRDT